MMQIDLQCSFLVGSAMAYIGRDKLPTAPPEWLARARMLAIVFGALIFTPVWVYITLRWTSWESMYVWDVTSVPLLVVALFPPALSLAALAGFNLTAAFLARSRVGLAALVNLLVAGSCVVVALVGWQRASTVATMAEFASGKRGNFLGSDLMLFVAAASVLLFAPAAVFFVRALRR